MIPDTVRYEIIDGVKCYAPELATQNGDFPPNGFERLYRLEAENFWFKARNRIILHLFKKYLGEQHAARVLELGCGTGFVLLGLSKLKNLHLSGAEIYISGLQYARSRLPQAEFFQIDATRMPFQEEFDAVGAFDVLEHINEDRLVLQNVFRSLKPGGLFFVSVPQHPFLWGSTDMLARHKRRYLRSEILEKLRSAGYKIEYASSFVFALFPFMVIARAWQKRRTTEQNALDAAVQELSLPKTVNFLFSLFMYCDELLIRLGLSLPWGGSMMVVARK